MINGTQKLLQNNAAVKFYSKLKTEQSNQWNLTCSEPEISLISKVMQVQIKQGNHDILSTNLILNWGQFGKCTWCAFA